MNRLKIASFIISLVFAISTLQAKQPELTPPVVQEKLKEMMQMHALYKQYTPELVKRTLQNYLDLLDPTKTYFIESEIDPWLNPTEDQLKQILSQFQQGEFTAFEQIQDSMSKAILRRRDMEKGIIIANLPTHVPVKEFKNMQWVKSEQELLQRLVRLRGLQIATASALNQENATQSLQRILKHQIKREEEMLNSDPMEHLRLIYSNFLKSAASALDTHTAYLTPEEAAQFMISVQQRLLGIGVQLRDDVNGFTITKIISGGPAAEQGGLKIKDRIIAVNSEPVVGMDITDVVNLIRGPVGTEVTLTVMREVKDEEDKVRQDKKDVTVPRGEVVLKETRFETNYEPFADGVIGYVRLHTFYQDQDSSSAADLLREIKKMKQDHRMKGLVLDLRYNTGGLLSQAIDVTGLFVGKGVIASIRDQAGNIQHLRHIEPTTVWDGPLIVLTNRASASAAEIVAQALQDYGRALVVGDDHSYGKGSFQTLTLGTSPEVAVDPSGEYKVTRGRYYTVSGKTPQLKGVISDLVVPGVLSESELGEQYAKYPLENDQISENFDDDLSDIPAGQRNRVRILYKFNLQPRLDLYGTYLPILKKNSMYRILNNKAYQKMLSDLKEETDVEPESEEERAGPNDLQLNETYNIMKDLLLLLQRDGKS